jgi:hypothetical protein
MISLFTNPPGLNLLTRIIENVFICSFDFLEIPKNTGIIVQTGITHIISQSETPIDKKLHDQFEILLINPIETNVFKNIPVIMDFLRKITLYKGRLLFVENSNNNLMQECIVIALNHIFKTSTYETYTLIKS